MSELIGVLDNAIQITGSISVTGQITGVLSAGINTASATAEATDIKAGKTAFVNGVKLTGAMPEYEATTITPGTADQIIQAGRYLAGDLTVKGDADLLSQNIKNGVNIFDVAGSAEAVRTSSVTGSSISATSTEITRGTGNLSKNNGLLSFVACLFTSTSMVFCDYWDLRWNGTTYAAARVVAGASGFPKISGLYYNASQGTVTVTFSQSLPTGYRLAYTATAAGATLG